MSTQFHATLLADDIKPGQMARCQVAGTDILLANVEGKFFAVDNICTHEDASLYLGCLKGDLVQCSLHGGKFNVKTGAPAEEPAEIPLRTFAVEIRDKQLWVAVEPEDSGQ